MKIGFISGWGSNEGFVTPFINNLKGEALLQGTTLEVQYFPWSEVLATGFPSGIGAGGSDDVVDTNALAEMFAGVDTLMGWSLGGLLSLHTPVKNIILLSSFAKFRKGDDAPGVAASGLRSMMMGLKISQKMTIAGFAKMSFAGDAEAQKLFVQSCMSHTAQELHSGLELLYHGDARGLLGGKNLLVIHGDNDKVSPMEMALHTQSVAKEAGASCRLHPMAGGHDLLEQYKEIFHEVSTFYGLK